MCTMFMACWASSKESPGPKRRVLPFANVMNDTIRTHAIGCGFLAWVDLPLVFGCSNGTYRVLKTLSLS